MQAFAHVPATERPARPESALRALLHRWLVQYNPLYLFSAALVLGGLKSPPPAAALPPAEAELPARVTHAKFGVGRVLRAEGSGDQRRFLVSFDAHGEKVVLARFVVPA